MTHKMALKFDRKQAAADAKMEGHLRELGLGDDENLPSMSGDIAVQVDKNQPWAHKASSILENKVDDVTCDEAHTVKNNRTQAWVAIFNTQARVILMTATSMYNSTLDLLGLLHLCESNTVFCKMNWDERRRYAKVFYKYRNSLTSFGDKNGGPNGTARGRVDFGLVRKLLLGACSSILISFLERYGGFDGVAKVHSYQDAKDGGLGMLINCAIDDFRVSVTSVTDSPLKLLSFFVQSSTKLGLLSQALLYYVVRRHEKMIIITDSPMTTWFVGLFVAILGIKAEWVRSAMNESGRTKAMNRFEEEDDLRVLIGSAQLIGVGVNLQFCHNMFVFQPLYLFHPHHHPGYRSNDPFRATVHHSNHHRFHLGYIRDHSLGEKFEEILSDVSRRRQCDQRVLQPLHQRSFVWR